MPWYWWLFAVIGLVVACLDIVAHASHFMWQRCTQLEKRGWLTEFCRPFISFPCIQNKDTGMRKTPLKEVRKNLKPLTHAIDKCSLHPATKFVEQTTEFVTARDLEKDDTIEFCILWVHGNFAGL